MTRANAHTQGSIAPEAPVTTKVDFQYLYLFLPEYSYYTTVTSYIKIHTRTHLRHMLVTIYYHQGEARKT
jgi:hypothetical protein